MYDLDKKYVLLFSGGQDSTTILLSMLREGLPKDQIYLCNMTYGQRHYQAEQMAIQDLVRFFKLPLWRTTRIVMPSLSALTGSWQDVSEPHMIDKTLPAAFVPGRNLAFILYAAQMMYSIKNDVSTLVIGVNAVDFSGYPDCRADTIKFMETAVMLGFKWPDFHILTPLVDKSKVEIIAEAYLSQDAEEALKLTHTCYNGITPSCRTCPACKIRAKAFSEYGIPDPREKYV